MELDRRLQLELKRKLFASRENNSKIEKSFVTSLGDQFQSGQSAVDVQGGNTKTTNFLVDVFFFLGCDLIASNYYHPNGHTMPFLIGLEYATYRYLKLPAKYASHYSFVSRPAECAICFTDFTIQWVKDDQGRILCNDCAVRPVKKKIKKESQKQLKRTIISCFTKEYGKISKTYERRKKRTSKENMDPADSVTSPKKSEEQPSEKTDEGKIEQSSKSIDESKPQESSENSSDDKQPADESDQNKGDNDEPGTNPATETTETEDNHESGNEEKDIPKEDEPMETDIQEDETGGILDQLSKGKVGRVFPMVVVSIL